MLHHVELNVSDLDKAEEFWGWFLGKLGYERYQKWDQGLSYRQGKTYIVFVQTETKYMDVPYHRSRVGLNHVAFHAESREHVDQMTAELRERGTTILYLDRHPYAGGEEHYAVFFEDPDRIKVELVAP